MICPSCFNNWKEIVEIYPHYMSEDGILFYHCNVCYSETPILLMEDSMAKLKQSMEEVPVCVNCRFQTNKPSTCSAYNKSVGRKQDASSCPKFKK
jgi:hypothetical protein